MSEKFNCFLSSYWRQQQTDLAIENSKLVHWCTCKTCDPFLRQPLESMLRGYIASEICHNCLFIVRSTFIGLLSACATVCAGTFASECGEDFKTTILHQVVRLSLICRQIRSCICFVFAARHLHESQQSPVSQRASSETWKNKDCSKEVLCSPVLFCSARWSAVCSVVGLSPRNPFHVWAS